MRRLRSALGQADQVGRLDVHREPRRVQCRREPLGSAHQDFAVAVRTEADQDTLARRPGHGDALARAIAVHRRVDALGGLAQRQFAQRDQVALAEEVLERHARALRHVDLAGVQPCEELVGRQVDELDLVGRLEHGVGHRLRWRTVVMPATTSLRLSRCWTLSVVQTSMPASRSSSTSCQRLRGVGRRRHWYAPARRPAATAACARARGRDRTRAPRRPLFGAWSGSIRKGSASRPSSRCSVSLRPCGST